MIESSEENNRLTRETVKVLDYPDEFKPSSSRR